MNKMNKIVIELTADKEEETPEQSERFFWRNHRTKSCSGYAKAVREVEKKAVGLWGWCNVEVRVTVKDGYDKAVASASSYLGNCSYYSAVDFAKNSGYFEQMVKEATKEAMEKTEQLVCRTGVV